MTTQTLFSSFMDMLKDLGIEPQADERDPYGTIRTQRVMTELEQVRDFPIDRLPAIREYAMKVKALNPQALIKEMRRVMAQEVAPAAARGAVTYSDAAIVAVLERQVTRQCNCETWPECQPEWRRKVMQI